jgi:hypothetical protein
MTNQDLPAASYFTTYIFWSLFIYQLYIIATLCGLACLILSCCKKKHLFIHMKKAHDGLQIVSLPLFMYHSIHEHVMSDRICQLVGKK